MFKVSEFSLIVGNDTKNKARSGFGNTLVNYYNNIFFLSPLLVLREGICEKAQQQAR
jgi:hypothetical protein